jgi:hypothetical protein
VCRWAEERGYLAVTLTTFRDVPWNMPFYARLGFEEIPAATLTPALRSVLEDEARRGLDPARRVAMRWRAQPTAPVRQLLPLDTRPRRLPKPTLQPATARFPSGRSQAKKTTAKVKLRSPRTRSRAFPGWACEVPRA